MPLNFFAGRIHFPKNFASRKSRGFLAGILFRQKIQVEIFDFSSCPRCFPEELQAGFDRRIEQKAANRNGLTQLVPAKPLNKLLEHHGERHAVHGVIRMSSGHKEFQSSGCSGQVTEQIVENLRKFRKLSLIR